MTYPYAPSPRKVTMTDPLLTLPPVPPMLPAPKPTRWRTLRTPDGFRPSPRQQQREARNCAEGWYQAIREWHTRISSDRVYPDAARSSAAFLVPVTMGAGSSGSMVGFVTYSRVWTPLGWLSESAVGAAITRQGGALERVQQGKGLSSLTDPRGGWHQEKASAMTYALAVLALAAELGDAAAHTHLNVLQKSQD